MNRVWFITGSGRGFGREFAVAALERGDRVAAAARRPEGLADLVERYGDRLLPLELDVTDRAAAFDAVTAAVDRFDTLDVVVNNAGYGLFGTVEEVDEERARAVMDANFFGAVWVTQAALPTLRAQRSGHIVQVSSTGGLLAVPNLGLYNASKWAMEAFSEALAGEVAELGIHVTILEPGSFATGWSSSAAIADPIAAYSHVREALARLESSIVPGDPSGAGPAVLRIVDAPQPPLRALLGAGQYEWVARAYDERLAGLSAWSG